MEIPKFFKQQEAERKKSIKQEKRIAKEIGGKLTKNSGATYAENDIDTDMFSIEAKITAGKGYRITVKEFEQIEKRAKKERIAMQIIEFSEHKRQLVLMDKNDLYSILGIN